MKHATEGRAVLRADMAITYTIGSQIHPLSDLRSSQTLAGEPTTLAQAHIPVLVAEFALEPFLYRTIYQFRTSVQAGTELLAAVRVLKAKIDAAPDKSVPLDFYDAYSITSALSKYEAVLGAELSLHQLYAVTQKAGFDTTILVTNGAACFPADVWVKVPEAVADLQQGTKCLAFEVFTAAGFHLHRANEAVLHKYWDAASNGIARPQTRNMGDYLNEMKQKKIGNPIVMAALKDLKDLHRNPLIHPEHSIETLDEAIALMNGVHNVMVHMLKEIPAVGPTPAIPSNSQVALPPP